MHRFTDSNFCDHWQFNTFCHGYYFIFVVSPCEPERIVYLHGYDHAISDRHIKPYCHPNRHAHRHSISNCIRISDGRTDDHPDTDLDPYRDSISITGRYTTIHRQFNRYMDTYRVIHTVQEHHGNNDPDADAATNRCINCHGYIEPHRYEYNLLHTYIQRHCDNHPPCHALSYSDWLCNINTDTLRD
jgi:hypothetical protein